MRIDNQRRSSNIEDERGRSGGGGGGALSGALPFLLSRFGIRGVLLAALAFGAFMLFAPAGLKQQVLGQLGVAGGGSESAAPVGSCTTQDSACDKISAYLGSTEDVWGRVFQSGQLPNYGQQPGAYTQPVLVLFSGQVQTGCGGASSGVGPFYCPADHKLYIDPTFYDLLANRLHAPGDFAQAYVIAHEIGHHVQSLIGDTDAGPQETQNQHSVRIELQADCFAGVWGHTAQADLQINDADLAQALNAAHNIGDDTLQGESGHVDPSSFTHGTSAQRMKWFRRGFDSGDARQCDTMQGGYDQL